MVRAADKIICLTHRAKAVLNDSYLTAENSDKSRFQVIPCCADFEHFNLAKVSPDARDAARIAADIPEDAYVLLYLGSLGTDYLLKEMIALFWQLLQIQPQAYFLFVSNNGENLVRRECANKGIPTSRIRFTSTSREFIPAHIALADMSVIFIRSDHTKVGCSPTKLAELFACNVPVIANSGVGDLDAIIDPARNSSVLVSDFSDRTLLDAVTAIRSYRATNDGRVNIRENSREFALERGVALYSQVYQELLDSTGIET
jgi:glycosyltransferase involved in cell wall biosynthesis